MFFQRFSVKRVLDALFDESWCAFYLPEQVHGMDWRPAD